MLTVLGFADVLGADPGPITGLADRWSALADRVDTHRADWADVPGGAAVGGRLAEHVTLLRRVSATLRQSADTVAAARDDAHRIRVLAARLGVDVRPDGTVAVTPGSPVSAAAVELIGSQARGTVRAANEADRRAARAIGELAPVTAPEQRSSVVRDRINRAVLADLMAATGDRDLAELRAGLGADHLLLGAGASGHVILATGDPDTSHNVVTVVPGARTPVRRAFAVLAALARAARDSDPGASTAVVWWAGRDAVGLADFQRCLRAAHTVLVGYGAGTTVVGDAVRLAAAPLADDVVALGGPGMNVTSADQLGVPDGHVWAGRAGDDPMPFRDGPHGPDPTSMLFGAKVFDAGTGGASYLTGGPSLRNVGGIATGRYTSVTSVPWWEHLP